MIDAWLEDRQTNKEFGNMDNMQLNQDRGLMEPINKYDERFHPFQARMREQGLPDLFIDIFAHYYHKLLAGETGLIDERDIEPIELLIRMEDLPVRLNFVAEQALAQTAMIKLNGGLGTSMGLEQAKSLLIVRDGYSFLDIIAEQAITANVPLVLMNSFATESDSRELLSRHQGLMSDVPQTFIQHMEPKVNEQDFTPAEWPDDTDLTWCPPGHGDIYAAMVTQGVLDTLLEKGYRYAFVSNADNLGATLHLGLLGYFVENELPFMMEVANRTKSDRKGGHLARRRTDGRLVLRESAQCPKSDVDSFQNIQRHRYFNTNNLWINLAALDEALQQHDYNLRLPMIRNRKTVDPRDKTSPPVFQLETAMGTAIEVFERAAAIAVPRTRFVPVKRTDDLLVVRSDVYFLDDDYSMVMDERRNGIPPDVVLDPAYFQFITDFESRFADGVPSMLKCSRLTISGDYRFGQQVVVKGEVDLQNQSGEQVFIPPFTELGG